jgi:hypothetical protein
MNYSDTVTLFVHLRNTSVIVSVTADYWCMFAGKLTLVSCFSIKQ